MEMTLDNQEAASQLASQSSPVVSQIRAVEDLYGPAGRLEALLNTGRDNAPYSALVCHPHPAGGGTMHNKVVYHAMKAFSALGLPNTTMGMVSSTTCARH
jgi:hypothetical protein